MGKSDGGGKTPLQNEKRWSKRWKVGKTTQVTVNGQFISCRLVNISAGGALIDTGLNVPVGTNVTLDIPGGEPAPGNVVRVTSSYTALAFEAPITLPSDILDTDT